MQAAKTLVCAVTGLAVLCGSAQAESQTGTASWYGPGFHGRLTANGERFDTNELTAAHKTLPFGTKVQVINATTGLAVVVRINDRGPYAHGRIIDLSRRAAESIGISGVAKVTVARLDASASPVPAD